MAYSSSMTSNSVPSETGCVDMLEGLASCKPFVALSQL